jgi:hypothetical protein
MENVKVVFIKDFGSCLQPRETWSENLNIEEQVEMIGEVHINHY